jgi:formylglycine-generating enzyme required for sulfatase activity
MVVVPAGKFRMGDIQGKGSKDEQPVHEVQIIDLRII